MTPGRPDLLVEKTFRLRRLIYALYPLYVRLRTTAEYDGPELEPSVEEEMVMDSMRYSPARSGCTALTRLSVGCVTVHYALAARLRDGCWFTSCLGWHVCWMRDKAYAAVEGVYNPALSKAYSYNVTQDR